MTQRLRLNFLEWTPDLDDFQNPGMTVADNVIHQPEGYKQVAIQTAGAFSTLTSVGTVTSIQIKPIGTGGTNLAAWLRPQTATPSVILEIGDPEVGVLGSVGSATLISVNSMKIDAFQVCELEDKVFAVANANGTAQAGTVISINLTGYFDYTVPTPPISIDDATAPDSGVLTLVGYAPVALLPLTAQPGAGSLALVGQSTGIKPLTLEVLPASLIVFEITCPAVSGDVTGTVSAGRTPFSYQWTWQSGGSGITINSPTSATTTFTNNGGGLATGVALLTVTDDNSDQATDTCSVRLECGT